MATTSSYDDGVEVILERRIGTDSDLYVELRDAGRKEMITVVFSKEDALKMIEDIKKAIGE